MTNNRSRLAVLIRLVLIFFVAVIAICPTGHPQPSARSTAGIVGSAPTATTEAYTNYGAAAQHLPGTGGRADAADVASRAFVRAARVSSGYHSRPPVDFVAADTAGEVLPTPAVESTKLQNIVNDLYKGTINPGRVGNGTTADAIRNELATGGPTAGRMHIIKGQEYSRALQNWLAKNPNAAQGDQIVARSLLGDLQSALGGN